MAAHSARRKKKPAAQAQRSEGDRALITALLTAVLVLLGLLGAQSLRGKVWLDWSDDGAGAAPRWLSTETVRATSGDGEVVKARVALDAPDADTRAWIDSRRRQVTLLMQISVAEQQLGSEAGADRVQRLARGMRDRLNGVLVASEVPPVRDLVIQDLVISAP